MKRIVLAGLAAFVSGCAFVPQEHLPPVPEYAVYCPPQKTVQLSWMFQRYLAPSSAMLVNGELTSRQPFTPGRVVPNAPVVMDEILTEYMLEEFTKSRRFSGIRREAISRGVTDELRLEIEWTTCDAPNTCLINSAITGATFFLFPTIMDESDYLIVRAARGGHAKNYVIRDDSRFIMWAPAIFVMPMIRANYRRYYGNMWRTLLVQLDRDGFFE